MRSVMSHMFSQVPAANIPRSSFDRSHGKKLTFDAGYLIPVFIDEILPGDTCNLRMTYFARLNTPIVPIMDNLRCDSFFFFVPMRLIWNNWQKFCGEQTDPGDSTDFTMPQMTGPGGGILTHSLSDYFGLPVGVDSLTFNSHFHRSYNLIYNEWFRDQNLQDSLVVDKDDGPDTYTDYVLKRRGKRHDYFTSCLPWPQKGEAVSLPLGTSAPVVSNGEVPVFEDHATHTVFRNLYYNTTAGTTWGSSAPGVSGATQFSTETGLETDLSEATAATINQLRQAFQIQRLYERDARGGTRYTEINRAHFGVVSPDARLQRPEYLGGGSTAVHIQPIAQTSETNETPQGNLAAMGVLTQSGQGFTKSFTEHGVVIGLISVRADLNYQQGLNRMFSRRTRWDFYWPALSHIGEQAVLKKEIYCNTDSHDNEVWGYQERYAEYRYKPSEITGLFRTYPSSGTSLDIWHLAQAFATLPALNASFIEDNPPVDRVIATPDEPHFMMDAYFQYRHVRPIPTYGVPGLIDHF